MFSTAQSNALADMTHRATKLYTLCIIHNTKKILSFVMNMTFISSREVKKYIFHEWRMSMTFISSREVKINIYFFTSRDEIKVIFMTKKNKKINK